MALPRPDEDDGRFARALLATTQADPQKVQQTQRMQMEAAARCHEVPPLCQLLLERHVVTEARMLAVLRLLQQAGTGPLKRIEEMVVRPTQPARGAALRAALSLRNPRTRAVALVLALLALGIGLWWRQAVATAPMMYVRCKACRKISRVPWSRTFPVRCPKCGRRQAYFLKVCPNGHFFTVKSPFVPEPCPVCGSPRSRPPRPDEVR